MAVVIRVKTKACDVVFDASKNVWGMRGMPTRMLAADLRLGSYLLLTLRVDGVPQPATDEDVKAGLSVALIARVEGLEREGEGEDDSPSRLREKRAAFESAVRRMVGQESPPEEALEAPHPHGSAAE